ncbi:unannotated protein [freshwater metagenome]|uniref:Unannotated protein n=1 Tax=freshwater metagenome TaxID=449393 RepID=A0A6J7Q2J2_9ZZZZ
MLRCWVGAPRVADASATSLVEATTCAADASVTAGSGVGVGVGVGSGAASARLPEMPSDGLPAGAAVTSMVTSPARAAVTRTDGSPSRIEAKGAVMVALGPAGPPPIETAPAPTVTVTVMSSFAPPSGTSPPTKEIDTATGVPTTSFVSPITTVGAVPPPLPPPLPPPFPPPPLPLPPEPSLVVDPSVGCFVDGATGSATGVGVFQVSPGGGSVQAGPPSPQVGMGAGPGTGVPTTQG